MKKNKTKYRICETIIQEKFPRRNEDFYISKSSPTSKKKMTKNNQLRYSLVKVLCLNHNDKKSSGPSIAYKVKDIRMALDLSIQHAKRDYRKQSVRLHLYNQSCCFSSIKPIKNSFKYAQSQYRT